MADYYPLVVRAVAGLEDNTGESRRALYERARAALVKQLRGVSPSLSESEITRERLALEEAIRKVEAEQARRRRTERASAAKPAAATAEGPSDAASSTAAPPQSPAAPPMSPVPPEPAPAASAAAPELLPQQPPADISQAEARKNRRAQAEQPAPDRPARPSPETARPASAQPSQSSEPQREPDIAAEQTEAALRALRNRLAASEAGEQARRRRPASQPAPEPTAEPERTQPAAEEPPVPPAAHDQHGDQQQPAPRRSGAVVKLVIALVVLAVLGAIAAAGYRQRDRIVALYHALAGGGQNVASRESAPPPKIEDRIGPASPEPAPGTGSRQTPQTVQPPPAVAQRVVLYEEDPKDPNGKRFVGSVIWRTETVSPGAGLAPELAVKANVEVPERHFQMTFSMVRNTDPALPASHTIDIRFILPANFPSGGVANVPGILMKQTEQTRGVPLAGLAVKVTNNVFLIGLSAVDTDVQRNTQLLRDRAWFDIPIVYTNGSRAILAMEKGAPGERAFNEAFTAWGKSGTASR